MLLTVESGKEGKTRSFSVELLAYATADSLWAGGQTDTRAVRPVWALLAGTEAPMQAFLANIRMGKKAVSNNVTFEWLKTAGYQFHTQRTDVGTIVSVYLPDLFRADPGMVDPSGVSFVALPTKEWLDEQSKHLDFKAALKHVNALFTAPDLGIDTYRSWNEPAPDTAKQIEERVKEWLPLSTLFCLFLDRRTRAPIIPDVRFQLQVMIAAIQERCAFLSDSSTHASRNWGHSRNAYTVVSDTSMDTGYRGGIACRSSHETIERILAAQTERYFSIVKDQ